MKKVPVVNFRYLSNGSEKDKLDFIRIFGSAIEEFGFVVLEEHGINHSLIDDCYKETKKLFTLNNEVKNKYIDNVGGGQRGYVGFGIEHAKNNSKKDLKEFWHVGREEFNDPARATLYPKNIWPEECPELKPKLLTLYHSLDLLSLSLLDVIGEYLQLPSKTLSGMAIDGNTILRLLHYPSLEKEHFHSGEIRSAEHEDINLMTILCGATQSGLQILTKEGKWLDIESSQDQLVIDTGDMMARITNDVLPSTTHRVVNPPNSKNESRFSMPFFVHAYGNCELKVLDNCISPSRPAKYSPILADNFLKERLRENGFNSKI